MSKLTNPTNEQELRKKLTKLISQDGWVDTQEVDVDGQVNEIFALIIADRKRVALEARIEELRLASDMQYMMRREDRINYCSKRIAELKAQQEETEKRNYDKAAF